MALDSTTGTFTAPTSNGTQAISGLGFQPKVVIFLALNTTGSNDDDHVFHRGAASGSGSSEQWALSVFSGNGLTTSDTDRLYNTGDCIALLKASATVHCVADLQSIDSDGFTLNWTTTTTAAGFSFIALGGSSLDVDVGTVSYPASIGTFSKTGLSFQPKAIQLATVSTAAMGTPQNISLITQGAAISASNRYSLMSRGENNQATSNTFRYQSQGAVIKLINASAAIRVETDFVSFNSDGFTLDNIDPPGAVELLPYIAYGGTINVDIGLINQPSNGNQSTTGLGFQPNFTFLESIQTASGFDTSINSAANNFGFSDSVNSVNIRTLDIDNQGTTSSTHSGDTTDIYVARGTGASIGDANYTSNDSDGFTLNWTNSDSQAREIFYFSIGDAAVAGFNTYWAKSANILINSVQ